MRPHFRNSQSGMTILEVMMAVLVVATCLIGMIQAVTLGSEMVATARRQTLAAQIIAHELESLRAVDWGTISNLSDSDSDCDLSSKPSASLKWKSGLSYRVRDLVIYNNQWYRCITNTNSQNPTNTNYWTADAPPYAGAFDNAGMSAGATFTLTHKVSDVSTGLREVTFTVCWKVRPSGISSSRIYVRKNSAYFGKYGLNLTYQRS